MNHFTKNTKFLIRLYKNINIFRNGKITFIILIIHKCTKQKEANKLIPNKAQLEALK